MSNSHSSTFTQTLSPVKINGVIQPYAWGGYSFIPTLTGTPSSGEIPSAELWMGAHPKGPATLAKDESQTLEAFIGQAPEEMLGTSVAGKFDNRLPYLFKVLDVKDMLSIQAHPSKKAAEEGFAREEAAGISRMAPHRNFRDDNHKPEIMVALTEFWLLHGFRSEAQILDLMDEVPEFSSLRSYFENGDYKNLYRHLMEMPQEEVDALLQPLIQRITPAYEAGNLKKSHPDFWAARAAATFSPKTGKYDRGIFSVYFFNLVNIPVGQAIFQDAGIPHAYLEGVNMELMANSDNVLRGGLTPKHIDVPELLNHLIFEAVHPKVLAGEQVSQAEWVYKSPAPDFELSCIQLSQGIAYDSVKGHSADTVIVMEGSAVLQSKGEETPLKRGDIFFAPANMAYRIVASGEATLYRATVPI
ncbi:MAG: mannose-6-phosphate isomerase, class I [Bacteroidota bacterium]